MTWFRALTLSLLISFLLHLSIVAALWRLPKPPPPQPDPTFMEWLPVASPTKELKDQSFVMDAEVPEKLKSPEKREARFKSKDDQSVLEETRAPDSGLAKNRSIDPLLPQPGEMFKPTRPRESTARRQEAARTLDNLAMNEKAPDPIISGQKKPETEPAAEESRELHLPNVSLPNFESGRSSFTNSLPPDIKVGRITALNTDRYLYYSFYSRVTEAVYHRWVNHISSFVRTYGRGLDAQTWVTQVEILLDRDGNFKKAIFHRKSGVGGVDEAPVSAFREANQIPNPPIEMIKDDGLIHVHFQFDVHFDPRYVATP